jgi:DNA replication and repair protein RecF
MRVTSIELTNFRNYSELSVNPGPGLNVFVGENAQGKSNLLEAFYVLATTKSPRASRDSEMVQFGSTIARLSAHAERIKEIDVTLELLFSQSDRKIAKSNGVTQTKLADVVGQVNAALFHALDLDIIRGEPAIRRRFLDLEISQTSPRYVGCLSAYRKTLDQRNSLLRAMRERQAGSGAREVLCAYDDQLASHGSVLVERRISFIDRLSLIAADVHHALSDTRDDLHLVYQPSFDLGGARLAAEIKAGFVENLVVLAREEELRGKTLIGPQRDDLLLMVNDTDSRLFASQGQQRTIALSLKLAERRLLEELVGEPPLLLLDDVLSDLDDLRRRKLFDHVAESKSQTFLTCTNTRPIPKSLMESSAIWHVEAGRLTQEG